MKISEVMTRNVERLAPGTTLQEAARIMRKLDCGFLPVSDDKDEKLIGVVTDRDIVVRAVAEGKEPAECQVRDIVSDKVLYCYADDEIERATDSMQQQGVYRLIVLDNSDSKQLCGIISLGDILRHGQQQLAASAASGITRNAA